MLVEFSGSDSNKVLPVVLDWVVDGTPVTVKILASHDVITAAKVLENFKNGRVIKKGETGRERATKDVVQSIGEFLMIEDEFERLSKEYVFTLEKLLEL